MKKITIIELVGKYQKKLDSVTQNKPSYICPTMESLKKCLHDSEMVKLKDYAEISYAMHYKILTLSETHQDYKLSGQGRYATNFIEELKTLLKKEEPAYKNGMKMILKFSKDGRTTPEELNFFIDGIGVLSKEEIQHLASCIDIVEKNNIHVSYNIINFFPVINILILKNILTEDVFKKISQHMAPDFIVNVIEMLATGDFLTNSTLEILLTQHPSESGRKLSALIDFFENCPALSIDDSLKKVFTVKLIEKLSIEQDIKGVEEAIRNLKLFGLLTTENLMLFFENQSSLFEEKSNLKFLLEFFNTYPQLAKNEAFKNILSPVLIQRLSSEKNTVELKKTIDSLSQFKILSAETLLLSLDEKPIFTFLLNIFKQYPKLTPSPDNPLLRNPLIRHYRNLYAEKDQEYVQTALRFLISEDLLLISPDTLLLLCASKDLFTKWMSMCKNVTGQQTRYKKALFSSFCSDRQDPVDINYFKYMDSITESLQSLNLLCKENSEACHNPNTGHDALLKFLVKNKELISKEHLDEIWSMVLKDPSESKKRFEKYTKIEKTVGPSSRFFNREQYLKTKLICYLGTTLWDTKIVPYSQPSAPKLSELNLWTEQPRGRSDSMQKSKPLPHYNPQINDLERNRSKTDVVLPKVQKK